MCDRRELERMREQRDDAIGRAVDAAGQLADITTERDALAEILHETTQELAEATARLARRSA